MMNNHFITHHKTLQQRHKILLINYTEDITTKNTTHNTTNKTRRFP